jgi:four helix bundle protein
MTKFKDWFAYQMAFELSIEIFEVTKGFPKEEQYSLTSQIRRSSRSVCANLADAYGKRRYAPHFVLKLTDAHAENNETQCWLDFAESHDFLTREISDRLQIRNAEIGKLIGYMIRPPEKFMHKGN